MVEACPGMAPSGPAWLQEFLPHQVQAANDGTEFGSSKTGFVENYVLLGVNF